MDTIWDNMELIELLRDGGVAVMPTDTIYGLVGQALNRDTVERIYKIRRRSPNKPCIILLGDKSDLRKFDIKLSPKQAKKFVEYSGTYTSVVVDCISDKYEYLHRGLKTLAFRIPVQKGLQDLLKQTGPLIAPSANFQGEIPSKSAAEAKEYFGSEVDLYVGDKYLDRKPSKIIRLFNDGTMSIIRE